MGCGSSKTLPVTPEGPGSPNGRKESVLVAPSPDHVSTPVGEDQRSKGTFGEGSEGSGGANDVLFKKGSEEVEGRGRRMKNGSAEKTKKKLKDISPPRGNSGRRENLAFEVAALDNEGGDSLIKKFPPKKFQKLEEQQTQEQITQELLEEKQAIAERRRKEILNQRVKSAKTTSARSAQARARVAESKEVDKFMAEEHATNPSSELPPLTNIRQSAYYTTRHSDHITDDTSSLRSHSTLSSATNSRSASTLVTPQQSAHLYHHQQKLQQQFEEEYEQLKQDRAANEVDDGAIEGAEFVSNDQGGL